MKTKNLVSILLTLALAVSLLVVPAAVSAADPPYEAVGTCPTEITIDLVDDSVVWTIDIDMEAASASLADHIGYALVISLDHIESAFQIHSNDGVDDTYAWGTHLYSEYVDGWHTGTTNTLVSNLDWVEATGDYLIVDNPDGIFTVTIDKAKLAPEFYWGVAIFARTCDTRYPAEWVGWSGDASTYATYTIPGGAVDMATNVLGDSICISVDPPSVNFGDVYPGHCSDLEDLGVTSCSSVNINLSATTDSAFYNDNLVIDGSSVTGWAVAGLGQGNTWNAKLKVCVPSDYSAGAQTGTLVIWAEKA